MIRECWPLVLVVAAWLCGVFLVFRVSAFRSDDPDYHGYFGVPYFWNWKYLNPSNFTAEGQKFLYWLWIDTALFAGSGLVAMAVCV
jgi:hypothetical protein